MAYLIIYKIIFYLLADETGFNKRVILNTKRKYHTKLENKPMVQENQNRADSLLNFYAALESIEVSGATITINIKPFVFEDHTERGY